MPQDLPIVDVEHVPTGGDHDVVIVTVTNTQHIGGNTVASTRGCEGLNRLGGGKEGGDGAGRVGRGGVGREWGWEREGKGLVEREGKGLVGRRGEWRSRSEGEGKGVK